MCRVRYLSTVVIILELYQDALCRPDLLPQTHEGTITEGQVQSYRKPFWDQHDTLLHTHMTLHAPAYIPLVCKLTLTWLPHLTGIFCWGPLTWRNIADLGFETFLSQEPTCQASFLNTGVHETWVDCFDFQHREQTKLNVFNSTQHSNLTASLTGEGSLRVILDTDWSRDVQNTLDHYFDDSALTTYCTSCRVCPMKNLFAVPPAVSQACFTKHFHWHDILSTSPSVLP